MNRVQKLLTTCLILLEQKAKICCNYFTCSNVKPHTYNTLLPFVELRENYNEFCCEVGDFAFVICSSILHTRILFKVIAWQIPFTNVFFILEVYFASWKIAFRQKDLFLKCSINAQVSITSHECSINTKSKSPNAN